MSMSRPSPPVMSPGANKPRSPPSDAVRSSVTLRTLCACPGDGDVAEPVKDGEHEGPVPEEWRATLAAIVDSLVRRDDVLAAGLDSVDPVSPDTTFACLEAVDAYGAVTLVPLPGETWRTSVALWHGDRWNCLVDLWTAGEGRSDLVLDVDVIEDSGGYRFRVHLVYVP
jgi:hypothetical protein